VTHFLANSRYVAGRIHRFYGRSSTVLHPPIDTEKGFIADYPDDYYLAVGRLVPYKRTDILIEACNRLRRSLYIVGEGPELKKLQAKAGPTVKFLGRLNSTELWKTYAHCRALLFAADEDFGMVPLEAQACGRPVIAFGKGGTRETVCGYSSQDSVNNSQQAPTGIFFSQQTAEAVANAILRLEANEGIFSPSAIRRHALQFDTSVFMERIEAFLAETVPDLQERSLSLGAFR
jgi:glycosyltransferase involved in cell wall biosynthesis